MKLFCKHNLVQDIRMVSVGSNYSEARLFGISCISCGKHWKHWTKRLERLYFGKDFRSKILNCIHILKG